MRNPSYVSNFEIQSSPNLLPNHYPRRWHFFCLSCCFERRRICWKKTAAILYPHRTLSERQRFTRRKHSCIQSSSNPNSSLNGLKSVKRFASPSTNSYLVSQREVLCIMLHLSVAKRFLLAAARYGELRISESMLLGEAVSMNRILTLRRCQMESQWRSTETDMLPICDKPRSSSNFRICYQKSRTFPAPEQIRGSCKQKQSPE